MTTFSRRRMFLFMGLTFIATGMFGREGAGEESYSAVAIGTGGGVGGRTMQFSFSIKEFTTDEQLQKYAALLKEKGQDALRNALEKEDVGQIRPTARVGNPIAIARKRQTASGTVITIVTARNMPFLEVYNSGRSTGYPFGFLQVQLDDKNQGTGKIMVAAKVRFDKKKGKYDIESYGNQYIKAVNVRPEK